MPGHRRVRPRRRDERERVVRERRRAPARRGLEPRRRRAGVGVERRRRREPGSARRRAGKRRLTHGPVGVQDEPGRARERRQRTRGLGFARSRPRSRAARAAPARVAARRAGSSRAAGGIRTTRERGKAFRLLVPPGVLVPVVPPAPELQRLARRAVTPRGRLGGGHQERVPQRRRVAQHARKALFFFAAGRADGVFFRLGFVALVCFVFAQALLQRRVALQLQLLAVVLAQPRGEDDEILRVSPFGFGRRVGGRHRRDGGARRLVLRVVPSSARGGVSLVQEPQLSSLRLQKHGLFHLRERRQATPSVAARVTLERLGGRGDKLLVAPQRERAVERVHAGAHVSSIRLDAIAHFAAPALVAGNARESLAVQTQARFLLLQTEDERATTTRGEIFWSFRAFGVSENKKAVLENPGRDGWEKESGETKKSR